MIPAFIHSATAAGTSSRTGSLIATTPIKVKLRHLEKSLGEEVEVRTYKPIDKQKEFTGILKSYDKDTITIQTEEKDLVFAKSDIAIIRLTLDF